MIDDAQWLDRVSVEVLGFVARRLLADRVCMLFAVREGEQRTVVLEGLQELTIGALPEEAANELFADTVGRRSGSWLAAGRCSRTTITPRPSTVSPSITCGKARSAQRWLAPICSTASGCAVSAAAGTPGSS